MYSVRLVSGVLHNDVMCIHYEMITTMSSNHLLPKVITTLLTIFLNHIPVTYCFKLEIGTS